MWFVYKFNVNASSAPLISIAVSFHWGRFNSSNVVSNVDKEQLDLHFMIFRWVNIHCQSASINNECPYIYVRPTVNNEQTQHVPIEEWRPSAVGWVGCGWLSFDNSVLNVGLCVGIHLTHNCWGLSNLAPQLQILSYVFIQIANVLFSLSLSLVCLALSLSNHQR